MFKQLKDLRIILERLVVDPVVDFLSSHLVSVSWRIANT